MNKENIYIAKRLLTAKLQSILFYLFRIFPIKKKKIVFTCIEGTTGYSCNPKYIAEELIRRNKGYELVWLVNDITKSFPKEIHVSHNSLWNRAYHLTTAKFWIDNSRKQLEVRKRKGQIYIQTWHAKLGFKPTCLDRGESFSRIAYLVSKHDSDMIDYVLSNSDWYDKTLPTGMLYTGKTLRTGSPRCDILITGRGEARKIIRQKYHLNEDAKILMYAPTFRGGSQGINRTLKEEDHSPDFEILLNALEKRFGGTWVIFLRLHPQLTVRHIKNKKQSPQLIDVSTVDDMYELLAGCDAFMTDYSSAAFDAAVMRIPIFLYADDYKIYEDERGKLLWDLKNLPFVLISNNEELEEKILTMNDDGYQLGLSQLFISTAMVEDGQAANHIIDFIEKKSIIGKKVIKVGDY